MKKILFIFAILISSMAKSQDPEIWGTLKMEGKLSNKWQIDFEGEERYNFDLNDVRYFHYDLGAVYSINKNFGIGLFYRDIYESKKGIIGRETSPHFDEFYKTPYGFKLRVREEYIIKYGKDNLFRLRIRPTYQTKIWKNFNPFVQDEVFLTKEDFTRNRFNAGITIKMNHFEIQPGYMLESNHKTAWANKNILWINTKLKI